MTDLTITEFGDAWVNSLKTDVNYGSTTAVHVKSGERRGYLRPPLPNLAGRTVLSAVLTGHAEAAMVSQTFTLAPATERWTSGKVTWANQPAINTGVNITNTGAPVSVAAGGTVTWNVLTHIQAVAAGTEWFGWRLTTDSTSTGQRFTSTESGSPAWELVITLSDVPDAPSNLLPSGGGSIGVIAPVLSWEFGDAGLGDTAQAQFRIQVDTPAVGVDPDEVTPDFDSGWVGLPDPQYDLFTSAFNLINQVTSGGDYETSATGMAGINSTVARSTAQAYQGTASLAITATSAATIQAVTSGTGTGAVDVKPSTAYAVTARMRPNTTARSTNWQYTAYNSGGTSVTAPTAGSAVAEVAGRWVEDRALFTTGSTVEFMRFQHAIAAAANGEVHYQDRVAIVKGGDAPTSWRVQVKDADGNTSDWSDWAQYTLTVKPDLIVDSPVSAFGDPTPTVAAHLSAGSVASWEAKVTGPDRSDIRYRTGARTGAVSFTVPLNGNDGRRILKDDITGWTYLRVYPTGTWASSVGDPPYLDVWIPMTWDSDAGVTAPTALTVTQLTAGGPKARWQWSRASVATAYGFLVDGLTVARVDAADITSVGGGVYRWDDGGQIPPLRSHTLSVRALESNERSNPASVSNYKHTVSGVWVIPDNTAIPAFRVAGRAVEGFARSDFYERHTTSTGEKVDIIYGTPSREGAFEGDIYVGNGWVAADVWAAVDAIEALRESKNRMGRLVYGPRSITVRFSDPDALPAEDLSPQTLHHKIRFGFVETVD